MGRRTKKVFSSSFIILEGHRGRIISESSMSHHVDEKKSWRGGGRRGGLIQVKLSIAKWEAESQNVPRTVLPVAS